MENKIHRGYAKFKINLILNRSQLDWFESLFINDLTPISEYIKTQINKAKQKEML